ncbi:hypothetical protein AMEX_G10415 [Astyanax mexicanus]|uniref:Uncharacterized protein n=1 Tax=Astyanax mexicanus TaxID=7994 RepID=A0A8T2LPT6_ASTMX|nr:hypothetical protein AMEX_G10415 [Astyanax mexicanus]
MQDTDALETVIEAVDEEDEDDDELESESRGRAVYRIAFEEYLSAWLKIASTKALNERITVPERVLVHYGFPSSEPDDLIQEKCQSFKCIKSGPENKRLKTQSERKQDRVKQMRKIYQLCRTPVPAEKDSVRDPEMKECWESEVDKLVEWTHSLSLEELDRQ